MAPPVDLITLENFEEKMAKWKPDNPNQLYALVDMGSNGIRFSISDLSPPATRLLRCVHRERAAISLFDALSASSGSGPSAGGGGAVPPLTFPPATISLVAATLARFRRVAVDGFGVPPAHVAVFATEAMRRAANAGDLLDAIAAAAPGLAVQVLAPAVETLFGAVGARSGFVDVRGLFLDLGGGSVQMTYMDTLAAAAAAAAAARDASVQGSSGGGGVDYEVTAARAGQSLPFGAARLIRVLEGAEAHVQATEKATLWRGMREAFENLQAMFPTLAESAAEGGPGVDVYLCGGGFRGYGSMLMHNDPIQPYPIPLIGSYKVSGDFFRQTKKMLEVNGSYEGKIFGMSKRRRHQFPAILAVVEALIDAVPRIRSVTFCAGGNRDGALMMKLPREIREANPLVFLPALEKPTLHGDLQQHPPLYDSILAVLNSSIPEKLAPTTVLSHGLGNLFVQKMWHRTGEDSDANASAALHDAVTRDPSCPGLTHLARALLGLTLSARWGGALSPADRQLHRNLQRLVELSDPDAVFWAEYLGTVAAAITTVMPAPPRTPDEVGKIIKFQSAHKSELGKSTKILLDIAVAPEATRGMDLADLEYSFKSVGKLKDSEKKASFKVTVTVQETS